MMHPWPWYVAGPLIGLFVPVLLLIGNRSFGISSALRHTCAAVLPTRVGYFRYDWRRLGSWNLAFTVGILIGGAIVHLWLSDGAPVALSQAAQQRLHAIGVDSAAGLVPAQFFSWQALTTWRGLIMIVGGGFLIGFGTAYAGGCTSGHAIAGLANFQLPSLIAVIGFFSGGLFATWLILPMLLRA